MIKTCSLCRFPRPAAEQRCAICGNEDFGPASAEEPDGLTLRCVADNEFGLAYRNLEEDLTRGEEDAQKTLWLAWLACYLCDYRAVEVWSHETSRLAPDSAEPHLLLGLVLLRARRWPEAVEECDAALRKPGLAVDRRAVLETMRAEAFAQIPEW